MNDHYTLLHYNTENSDTHKYRQCNEQIEIVAILKRVAFLWSVSPQIISVTFTVAIWSLSFK